jgi:hypothetical protein
MKKHRKGSDRNKQHGGTKIQTNRLTNKQKKNKKQKKNEMKLIFVLYSAFASLLRSMDAVLWRFAFLAMLFVFLSSLASDSIESGVMTRAMM